MGVLKKKRGVAFFGPKGALRSIGVVAGIVGIVALIGVFSCQQTAGVRPSATPSKVSTTAPQEAAVSALTNAHCPLCHRQQPETIQARGEKHKTEVGCLDCHVEHPPEGTEAVPECSMCHSGESHYELQGCASCHSDVHAPLDLRLEGSLIGPCLTCHQPQGDELQKHPSMHTELACNECHEVHRQIPDCTQCHEKHTEDMDFAACVSCHPVHMPLVVTYSSETPSHYCGGCHEVAFDLLAKNTTKHHELSCVFCHKNEHKTVPPCFACHPNPHPKAILDKYPKCGQCHGIAHDLKG